jgi:hypothetical protein
MSTDGMALPVNNLGRWVSSGAMMGGAALVTWVVSGRPTVKRVTLVTKMPISSFTGRKAVGEELFRSNQRRPTSLSSYFTTTRPAVSSRTRGASASTASPLSIYAPGIGRFGGRATSGHELFVFRA